MVDKTVSSPKKVTEELAEVVECRDSEVYGVCVCRISFT